MREARAPANPTSFTIRFIAATNQLQSPSAEDDVLSSAGRDQIATDEDEGEQDQDEIEWSEWDHDLGGVLCAVERSGKLPRYSYARSALSPLPFTD